MIHCGVSSATAASWSNLMTEIVHLLAEDLTSSVLEDSLVRSPYPDVDLF